MNELLLSVAVITYNSSKYVLETLESIRTKTYKNIELIVSDDCSTDKTVDICKDWIEKNKDRFVRTELIAVNKNTGITANANRALRLAKGEWIKFIAGDDFLFPQAMESHVKFISQKEHKKSVIVVSSIQLFKDNIKDKRYIWPNFKISNNPREQLRRQLIGTYIKASGVFIQRDVMIGKFGEFDEKYPMYEDDPLWVLYLTNGYNFHFNSDILVGYRIHDESVSNCYVNKDSDNPFSFWNNFYSFKNEVSYPLMLKNKFYLEFLLCRMKNYINRKKTNIFYCILKRMIDRSFKVLSFYNESLKHARVK